MSQNKAEKKYVTVIMQNAQHVQEAVLANLLALTYMFFFFFNLCLTSTKKINNNKESWGMLRLVLMFPDYYLFIF